MYGVLKVEGNDSNFMFKNYISIDIVSLNRCVLTIKYSTQHTIHLYKVFYSLFRQAESTREKMNSNAPVYNMVSVYE